MHSVLCFITSFLVWNVLYCTSKSKNAVPTSGPGTEHSPQDFWDTSNQRLSSVTERQPDRSLLDSVAPMWLYYFSLIFDQEVACQPLFCRETDLTVLHSCLFFGLSGSWRYTVWQKCLWPVKYWLLSPVSWIWISDSKLGSWSMIWTWMYVETECWRSYEMYSDNVIFHRLFCSCRPFT